MDAARSAVTVSTARTSGKKERDWMQEIWMLLEVVLRVMLGTPSASKCNVLAGAHSAGCGCTLF
jgi:hypothetical protein